MTIKEMKESSGLSFKKLSELLNIPIRTIENWSTAKTTPPAYVLSLIEYKLKKEGFIMKNLLEKMVEAMEAYIEKNGAWCDDEVTDNIKSTLEECGINFITEEEYFDGVNKDDEFDWFDFYCDAKETVGRACKYHHVENDGDCVNAYFGNNKRKMAEFIAENVITDDGYYKYSVNKASQLLSE